eukprot:TRINITY_DN444_c0_g1_i5.p3 TRINITY_DN444_c0_g1~~TRINITY_DN444_c0_g1_i5.p3  ORF type:complete len:183 (-),score=26.10 TRINITY_DN444_c0_g1_i5:376-924(-)
MPAPSSRTVQTEQINAEIFSLTYGSMVRQLINDLEDIEQVNTQLEKMGYRIGLRLIEEFLAKQQIRHCGSFKDTAEVIAKQGFFMFLNIQATVANWNQEGTECSLILTDNPLAEFVELPEEPQYKQLKYCNILCGVIRGVLEQVNIQTECHFVKDMLQKDDCYEIRLKFLQSEVEKYPFKDE